MAEGLKRGQGGGEGGPPLLTAAHILWQRITFGDVTALVDLANSKKGGEKMREDDAAFLVKPRHEAACMAARFDEKYAQIKVRFFQSEPVMTSYLPTFIHALN